MTKVSARVALPSCSHADSCTETLAGSLYLIEHIDTVLGQGDSVNCTCLTRLVIISSSFLAEQIFDQAYKKYIDEALSENSGVDSGQRERRLLTEWSEGNTLQKKGIMRALNDWPTTLIGHPLPLGAEPLQSLKALIDKRNKIVHKLNDWTDYEPASDIARSALYTAVEASKAIWGHFFPSKPFPYHDWLAEYPVPDACYFSKLQI
jgi:hypothetical protein